MPKGRAETWLTVLAVAAGIPILIAFAVLAVVFSAKPIHPPSEELQSSMHAAPSAKWAGAVKKGQQAARAAVIDDDLPGLSVAVGVDGALLWAEGFGWADVQSKSPVTPGTQFRIGHVSKALTSAGVGLLVDRGKLHFGERIQAYVPAFPEKQWPVNLRQLMGHIAGVRHYRNTEWGDKPTIRCERASDGLAVFADDPLLFEPESRYKYSTYGWVLVSAAVEAAGQAPFFDFMRAQVFEPLGLAATTSDSGAEAVPGRATSYYSYLERPTTSNVDYSCFAGAGGFVSTPSDLVRFGMAMMGGQFLQPTTLTTLQTPQQLKSGEDTAYGLGWMLETVDLAGERTRMVFHASRTMEGAGTTFLTFPERNLAVAVSSNMSFANTRFLALRIAEAFAKRD